jgi:hypothetical protein
MESINTTLTTMVLNYTSVVDLALHKLRPTIEEAINITTLNLSEINLTVIDIMVSTPTTFTLSTWC